MYEWFKDCCPVCGQTSPSSSAPCQTANYTAYKQRQDIVKSKLCYDCTRSRKFMKYQKWRKRKRHQECFGHAPYSNKLVSTSLKTIQCPSWILVLTLTLMLVCCQGNDVRPDPTVIRTELPDVIVPVGKAFYYKIPVSAFQCEVEQLMVTEDSNRFLSHWLAYNSLEHELYGVPSNSDIGTYTILVVAIARGELKRGKICGSKTFVITVPAEGDAKIPIPLMSAALQSAVMGEDGSVQFDNPNMVCRMPCFPGMHTTFASVLVNTDFIQLNGHERILLLQKVAEHLGITSAKLSGFSDQVPHPLISGLESPSLIATGAGDGRFVKGLKTVFTWSLGCGALRVNKTTISHLTTSSQDGTFSRSVGHSIFGWHIMSGVQKSLPKIRVRRAALVGTPTPTTTVAIPTAVSVTSTTMIFNDSMSLSRVFPSVSSTISLTPSVVSSALVAPTLSPKLTASSVEFMATLNLSASEIQTLNATVLSPSTKPKSTADAVTSVRTSATAPLLSPSLLLPTQNVTVVLSPSPTATFQTATFSPTPRINSSVEEVKTTSVAVQSSLRVSPSISESAVGSTSLETRNSSSTAKGQEMSPTLSKVLNQTATLVDSLSQTMELRTVLVTISNQTSLMMTSISAASSVTSATSTSVINDTVASLSIFPSTNMTSTSEMISSFISQPNRTKSLTPSTNQTGSSPTLNVPSSVSASKTSLVVMTTVLSTTNSTQVIPTSSSVVLQRSTRDLVPSSSQTSFTPALNLTSSYNVTRSRPVLTTAINMSVSQNTTNVVKSTPSSVVLQPNKTDMVPGGNKTTMSPVLSQTPQVTMTTATFVIAPTTRIATSSLVGSGIPSTAIPTVLATSPRFSTTTNSTKSQVLSASVSNSTHVSVIGSTVTLSPNMSSGDNESLSVSPALNKTTQIVITESPVSPVLSLSTEIESSEPISAVPTTDVSLKPTTFGVTVSEKSKTTQMESASGVPTLSTISVIGSALLPSESGVLSRTATTELESSPAARISSSRVATRRLNSTALLSSTSRVSLNLSRVVEPATTSHSLIRDSSSTVPLLIVSSLVLMSSVSVTEDLVTSSVATRSFISSSLSDRLESTIAVTAQPSVIIPSSIDAVESSLAVIAVNSSSPVLFANASVTSVSIPSLVSTSQLVSHTVVKISSTERTTRVSSITVALPSPTFTSDVTPSPFSTPLPSTTRTAVVTSKTPIMDTSSLPPTTTLGLSVFKTSATTGARNVTADSQAIEVTHSAVTLFPSMPSRVTRVCTGILTTLRYLSTSNTNIINDTGLPSIPFSPSSIGTSFLLSDTTKLKRTLSVIKSSARKATVTALSSLTSAVPSMVPKNSSAVVAPLSTTRSVARNGSHSLITASTVRSSISSSFDLSTVTFSLGEHGSSVSGARTLSVNETKPLVTVFSSMSSPQFRTDTSTPTTNTFFHTIPLNKTNTQTVVVTRTVDITELATSFIPNTARLATKSPNTTAVTQVVNERTSTPGSISTVLSSVDASTSELVSIRGSFIFSMLTTTVAPSLFLASSVETSYSVSESRSSIPTRILATAPSVLSIERQSKSISSTPVLNETMSELSTTISRQSSLVTEEKSADVTVVTLPTQSLIYVTKSSLLQSSATVTTLPGYSVGRISTAPSALRSTSSQDFSLTHTESSSLPSVKSALPSMSFTTESPSLSTDSTERAFSSATPSPTLPRTTRAPLKRTTVSTRSADITRKSMIRISNLPCPFLSFTSLLNYII